MNRRHFIALSTAAASMTRVSAAPGNDKPLLTFGMVTDVQYADADPEGERHYRESIPKLKLVAEDLAKQKLPFSLHLGDVIDRKFASYAEITPHFKAFGHPVKHLLGNHDYSVEDAEKDKPATLLEMPGDHYAFTESGVRFVMLDTNEVSTYKHPKGSPEELAAKQAMEKLAAGKPNYAKPWNGGVSETQLAWLEKELAAADEAKQPVIVCGHHPILPDGGLLSWNSRDILATIRRHPSARAYFCGHNHAGAEAFSEGLPCITFKSVLHEPGVNSWSVIRLFADRLEIDGRGREKSRTIPLRPLV